MKIILKSKLFRYLLTLAAPALFILWCNYLIVKNSERRLFNETAKIPFNEVGLVPGTCMLLKNDRLNPYFRYRMEAAAELFHHGKIKHIIVSGDNHCKRYDEPTDMMNYLVKLGIPHTAITRDYAGFRTFDSMIRAKLIFGVKKLTVISQKYHNERALFIADHYGLDVIGYNARDPFPNDHYREYFARVKAVLDVYLLRPKPHFLGKKEPLTVQK